MLEAQAWPESQAAPGWQAEARRFRGDAAARFSGSMRPRLDLDKIYRRALRSLPDTVDGRPRLACQSVPADAGWFAG